MNDDKKKGFKISQIKKRFENKKSTKLAVIESVNEHDNLNLPVINDGNTTNRNTGRRVSVQLEKDFELDIVNNDFSTFREYLFSLARENNCTKLKNAIEKLIEYITINLLKDENSESKSVHDLLKEMLDNERDEISFNVLSAAVRYNSLDAAKLLVSYGADVNGADEAGFSALHAAAWGRKMATKKVTTNEKGATDRAAEKDRLDELKNEAVIDYLISRKANPNGIFGENNHTPLISAAIRGNVSAVRALVRCKDVNVDAVDVERRTPLHIAAAFGWASICELLIKANASVFCQDKRFNTPLHFASAQGNCQIISALLQTVKTQEQLDTYVNQTTHDCESPLTLAIANGCEEAVALLLNKGANVNVKHKKSNTTLHLASLQGNINILKILLENGADINEKNEDFDTSLHVACESNNVETVKFLLANKADIEARNKLGQTPFLTCFQSEPTDDNLTIIKLLTDNGADVNATGKSEITAALLATQNNNVKALEFLLNLKQCQDLANRVDKNSNSPLHIAAKGGHLEAFKCLIKYGAVLDAKNVDERTPLHIATICGNMKIIQYILDHDQDLNLFKETDSGTSTALHLAMYKGHEDVVKKFLLHSLDTLEFRNGMYWAPLDVAITEGHKNIVEILLEHGAKISGGDDANPALHLACQYGRAEIVQLLLDQGAPIDKLDCKGRNCLEVALDAEKNDVAKVLVSRDEWKDFMKHSRTTSCEFPSCLTTPLRELIKTMPDVAKIVLDKCVGFEKSGNEEEVKVYNYELIDDVYSNWSAENSPETQNTIHKKKTKDVRNGFNDKGFLRRSAKLYTTNVEEIKKNHPLMIMVSQDNEELLDHEVVKALVSHKWGGYVRYIYYSGLLLYIVFLSFLTNFAVNIPPYYNFAANFSDVLDDFCHNRTSADILDDNIPPIDTRVRFSQYMTLTLSLLNISKEFSQWYYRGRNYVTLQNVIEITLYVCALIFVVDWNACSRFYGYRMPEQWLFGVVAAILAWVNLVLMVRQFPSLGIYVVMFTDVLTTFAKFFVVFFLFIVAFAMAFFMLFQNQAPFQSFALTLVKTLAMMVGELDYTGIFYTSKTEHAEMAYSPLASQVVFFIFAIVMTILLMNLLVGLAVDDIKSVQNKAALKRLAMKVELVLEIEYIAPDFVRRKWMIGREVAQSNNDSFWRRWFPKSTDFTSTSVVESSDEKEKSSAEEREVEKYENVIKEVGQLKQCLDDIKSQQNQLKKLVSAVETRFEINTTEEGSK